MYTSVMIMDIPKGTTVTVQNNIITVQGPKGSVVRPFSKKVVISTKDNSVIIEGDSRAIIGTWESHVKNMIYGVNSGFLIELKVIYAHFPIGIKVQGKEIIIENFIGEKQPRKARIMGDTKVELQKDFVKLSGPNKEDLGNTYNAINQAINIKKKDDGELQN